MKVFVLVEDSREGEEVLLVTESEETAIRGAIEILRQNNPAQVMHSDVGADSFENADGHIWCDFGEFDKELKELGETAFWSKYNNAWPYAVCSIWSMVVI